jgi:hypothetical protein
VRALRPQHDEEQSRARVTEDPRFRLGVNDISGGGGGSGSDLLARARPCRRSTCRPTTVPARCKDRRRRCRRRTAAPCRRAPDQPGGRAPSRSRPRASSGRRAGRASAVAGASKRDPRARAAPRPRPLGHLPDQVAALGGGVAGFFSTESAGAWPRERRGPLGITISFTTGGRGRGGAASGGLGAGLGEPAGRVWEPAAAGAGRRCLGHPAPPHHDRPRRDQLPAARGPEHERQEHRDVPGQRDREQPPEGATLQQAFDRDVEGAHASGSVTIPIPVAPAPRRIASVFATVP